MFLSYSRIGVKSKTYTHSPLADTTVLHSERHELNIHAEGKPF